MANLKHITFACTDPDRLADFWAAAVGGELHELSASIEPVIVEQPDGPQLLFSDQPCTSREDLAIHLDLEVDDREAAEARLTDLGAAVRERKSETVEGETIRWTVMEDPAGYGFCISEY